MPPPRFSKALVNENKHPYVVELAVVTDGMDAELSGQIVRFHKSRHIQPRHGRTTVRQGQFYYRWCFSDLLIARAFVEEFGAKFCKPQVSGL
jgi:hypothetical protein